VSFYVVGITRLAYMLMSRSGDVIGRTREKCDCEEVANQRKQRRDEYSRSETCL
jgi:hypothetical protein